MEDELFSEANREFRRVYARYVRMLYPNVDEYTSLVIAEMAANKAKYGVIYPEIYENYISVINNAILKT
jgi:hypothetical protein